MRLSWGGGVEEPSLAEGENGYPQPSSSQGISLPPVPRYALALAAARTPKDELTTTLSKVSLSSGLWQSTKIVVLESMLDSYLMTTHSISILLSYGSNLPFTCSFILRKTASCGGPHAPEPLLPAD